MNKKDLSTWKRCKRENQLTSGVKLTTRVAPSNSKKNNSKKDRKAYNSKSIDALLKPE